MSKPPLHDGIHLGHITDAMSDTLTDDEAQAIIDSSYGTLTEVELLRQQLAAANARVKEVENWLANNAKHTDACFHDVVYSGCNCGLTKLLKGET